MRILIVNDDGIHGPGLEVAEAIATEVAGPEGEIWVVAPERERSGTSHAVSYTEPLRVTELAPRRYAVEGFPADCALFGLRALLRDTPPDLVLSGVNRGFNLAEDVIYSGTVGAAMDAAMGGARAVSMSQAYSRGPDAPLDLWGTSKAHGVATLRKVLAMPFEPGSLYNINFPARAPDAVMGTTVVPQGLRQNATFEVDSYEAANGRQYYFLRHGTSNRSAEAGSDAVMAADGWITITPLHARMTATHLIDGATAVLQDGQQAEAKSA